MGFLNRIFGRQEDDRGATAATAIVVGSIEEEYEWISRHCPGYGLVSQALAEVDGKPYDILTCQDAAGSTREIYFDISSFFGK
ncbi:MAG: hypothetical protein K8T91_08005 [Planctomycetes bacterium]|nr:hypothetical protein [Planctomycetota bacterium]